MLKNHCIWTTEWTIGNLACSFSIIVLLDHFVIGYAVKKNYAKNIYGICPDMDEFDLWRCKFKL